MSEMTAEQTAKVAEMRRSAALQNGVQARVARRALAAEVLKGADTTDVAEAAAKAVERETFAVTLWDADGDGDVDALDCQIIEAYYNTTKQWVASTGDTWLRHAEMAANPEAYMATQDGTVQIAGQDGQPQEVNLNPDNPDAVAAFRARHEADAATIRAALDAAEAELAVLAPHFEGDDAVMDGCVVTDAGLFEDQGIVRPVRD